ncbi:YmfQ family protein [Cohnella lupini]|uniref:Uncharacterized protein DUF2313 n=1 Tax=Cohnella lupini TaxID=1294267 RepID=A0A3D9ISK1_9BACL|nr:YmfQ family protein [Cohnella lupini]RED64678.1 uncharacterized protein DUF2313 [Cohnella lupini]
MSNLGLTSVRGKEMMGYLPEFYATSRSMQSILASQGKELDDIIDEVAQKLDQQFVQTATWGLDQWERELGIETNSSKPVEQRRSVIYSKIRGVGTVTTRLIKRVAEAFDGGQVDVIPEEEAYSFTVKFIDTLGIPPNLDDLKAAIEEIKPAHLSVDYSFTYTTFGALQESGLTFGDIENIGITFGQLETWDIE